MKTDEEQFEEWNKTYTLPNFSSLSFVKDGLKDAFLAGCASKQAEIEELKKKLKEIASALEDIS